MHENSPLNVLSMTNKQWYTLLLEKNVTMEEVDGDRQQFIPCRTEVSSPGHDWGKVWQLARSRGLGPEIITFLWRLLHRLLPTQDRLHRIVRITTPSPNCKHCQDQVPEDLAHAFFGCNFNSNAGTLLLRSLSSLVPGITAPQILCLSVPVDISDELPVVWLISNFLNIIWINRVEKKRVQLFQTRAELEARTTLLRETRFSEYISKILNLIQVAFE